MPEYGVIVNWCMTPYNDPCFSMSEYINGNALKSQKMPDIVMHALRENTEKSCRTVLKREFTQKWTCVQQQMHFFTEEELL